MTSQCLGVALGALCGLGLATAAQAMPAGAGRAAMAAIEAPPVLVKTHGRRWCERHRRRHVHGYRYYGPVYGYRAYRVPSYAYYGWVAPRRYYSYGAPRYYDYYGYRPLYRRSGFSIWW